MKQEGIKFEMNIDGIILINKEANWTSNDVVQKIKGICQKKVGHCGTLDPLATGVLPILVGQGTLLSKYLVNHDKEYIATIKLGEKRTTGDLEGDIIAEKEVTEKMLDDKNVKSVLKEFQGNIKQIPPMYSAIKVNGKKLYEYARKGQKVSIPARNIEIYNIELLSISKEEKEIKYKVCCSKGTYIRTLSEDIAQALGTVGYMKKLQRTKVGNFLINNSIKISEIKDIKDLSKKVLTIENFFSDKEKIVLKDNDLKLFLNGVNLANNLKDDVYKIYNQNNAFVGIGIMKDKKLKRDIIL